MALQSSCGCNILHKVVERRSPACSSTCNDHVQHHRRQQQHLPRQARRAHRLGHWPPRVCLHFLHSHNARSTGHCDRHHRVGAAARPLQCASIDARHAQARALQPKRDALDGGCCIRHTGRCSKCASAAASSTRNWCNFSSSTRRSRWCPASSSWCSTASTTLGRRCRLHFLHYTGCRVRVRTV